jgi:hypothetical protein
VVEMMMPRSSHKGPRVETIVTAIIVVRTITITSRIPPRGVMSPGG